MRFSFVFWQLGVNDKFQLYGNKKNGTRKAPKFKNNVYPFNWDTVLSDLTYFLQFFFFDYFDLSSVDSNQSFRSKL